MTDPGPGQDLDEVDLDDSPVDDADVEPDVDVEPDADGGTPGASPDGADAPRIDPTLPDLILAAAALFLLIANMPGTFRGSPILLTLILWPLGAVGVVGLVLAIKKDRAAQWGLGFLGWAVLSTVFSAQPALSWDGGWGADRGFVYFACYLGCWAVGRRRGTEAVRLVTGAILLGVVLNALIAFVQAATPTGTGLISLVDGRAMGFTLQPVMLGALMCGGVAMTSSLIARAGAGNRWALLLPVTLGLAAAGNLAGSRIAIIGILVFGVWASWGGRAQILRTGLVALMIVGGLVLGSQMIETSGTGRVDSATSSGVGNRLVMWEAGGHAMVEHPVFGWGPNRFRSASSDRATLDFALREGADRTFADAHNVFVEIGVATGIPGLIGFCGFLWFACRRARGPLAWYAAGVALTWLVEPFSVATVPTVALALGLAALPAERQGLPDPPPEPPTVRWVAMGVATVLALVGLGLSVRMVAADRLLGSSTTSADQTDLIGRAHRLLPNDPAISDLYARTLAEDAVLTGDKAIARRALDQAEETVRLDPESAVNWVDLGVARERMLSDALLGSEGKERWELAREAYTRAQELSPWNRSAMFGLFVSEMALENPEAAATWEERLCQLDACPRP